MVVTVDGYDGTGKTTLAKKIAEERGFIYIEKPFILKFQYEHGCSYKEAKEKTIEIEKKLFEDNIKKRIIDYYCDGILWIKNIVDKGNIVLDRGILTVYAVCGTRENEQEFIKYLNQGIAFDCSIYLTADDIERRRIFLNNPNDPDLKYPVKWRENNLEEFADETKICYYKIRTDGLTKDEVLYKALEFLDKKLILKDSIAANKTLIKKCLVIK